MMPTVSPGTTPAPKKKKVYDPYGREIPQPQISDPNLPTIGAGRQENWELPPQQTTGGQSGFDIPTKYAEALNAAARQSALNKRKGIAENYASQRRQLEEDLARRGYGTGGAAQSGEIGNLLYNLAMRQAGETSQMEQAEYADLANKKWQAILGERSYEQQKELQGLGQAGQEKLKGMDIGLERERLAATKDIAEKQLGFSYSQLASTEGQNAAQRALTEKLTAGGWDHDKAMQQAQLDTQKLIAGQQIDMQKYGIDINAELQSRGLGLEQQRITQAGEQFGQTMGLEQQKLQATLDMFKQQYGSVDADGNYVPGTAVQSQMAIQAAQNTFTEKMAQYQSGYTDANGVYVPGVDYQQAAAKATLDANLAASAEEAKVNAAHRAKIEETYNTMMNGILTGAIGKDWDRAAVDQAYNHILTLSEELGVKPPDWVETWRQGHGMVANQPEIVYHAGVPYDKKTGKPLV